MSTKRQAVASEPEAKRPTLDLVRSTSTELFAERGFAATTMRQLADRASLPLSAFYYYFNSKYEVLLAIMDKAMTSLEVAAADAALSVMAPEDRVAELVQRHVIVHLEDPAVARVADGEIKSLQPDDRAAIVARRDAYESHLRDALEDGVASGTFTPGLDIPVASMAILTMATGVVDWWHPGGRYTIAETAAMMSEFALGLARGGNSG